MKILVLGLTPSKHGGKSKTLETLWSWLDRLNVHYVSFDNIYHDLEETDQQRCERIFFICQKFPYDKIITLGVAPSSYLRVLKIDHFPLPHPSGLNRKLNDPLYVQKQLDRAKDYLCS